MSGPPQQELAGSLLKFSPRSNTVCPWYMNLEPWVVRKTGAAPATSGRVAKMTVNTRKRRTNGASWRTACDRIPELTRLFTSVDFLPRYSTWPYPTFCLVRAGTRIWFSPRAEIHIGFQSAAIGRPTHIGLQPDAKIRR